MSDLAENNGLTERHDHAPVWAALDQEGNADGKICGSKSHIGHKPMWPCQKIRYIDRIEQLEAALRTARDYARIKDVPTIERIADRALGDTP